MLSKSFLKQDNLKASDATFKIKQTNEEMSKCQSNPVKQGHKLLTN